jgi:general secretion pathway protein K
MTTITMLTVLAAELLQNASTSFQIATSERDRLRAEYLAKSGLNLTRLLIANEPAIRQVVSPMYQLALQRPPPQLNVWDFAHMLLAPFASKEDTEGLGAETGIDFGMMEGLTDTHGTFDVITVPENAKINVNKPLFFAGDDARGSTARQLYTLMGGFQSPDSPYDPMFAARDPDGFYTTRLDIVSAMIDWWDYDQQRTIFDPGALPGTDISVGGSEDDAYSQMRDPYAVKNAPYDSIEELRMIRGVGDDYWATFVEGQLDDPRTRSVTIYGSGAVNVNLAPPVVLLARMCSFLTDQPLCRDPLQQMAFTQLLDTAKSFIPIALFSSVDDFVNFVTGTPTGRGLDMYTLLQGILGPQNPLMAWTPVVITADQKRDMAGRFLVAASIFTIQSTGTVGKARAKMTMVVNFDPPWKPPLGVTATRPPLGAVHYYRLE